MSKEPPGNPPAKPKHFTTAHDGARDPFKDYIKKMYDEVASEPLPDDLRKLLDELDQPRQGARQGKAHGTGQGDA